MGYRVVYEDAYCPDNQERPNFVRTLILAAVFAVILLAGIKRYWPEGTEVLMAIRSRGPWTYGRNALETLADALRDGTPLSEAVTAFCRSIVNYGIEYAA